MPVISAFSPTEVHDGETVLACEHDPPWKWLDFKGEAVVEFRGEKIKVDYMAVCDACYALPIEEVNMRVGQKMKEGAA